jgi:hypothetical protein
VSTDLFGGVSKVDDGGRSLYDFYETPTWMTRSLLAHEPNILAGRVLECCSGRDAITRVLRAYGCEVTTNDIDREHPAQTHFDVTNPAYWEGLKQPPDWIVTNPPFSIAFEILVQAHQVAKLGVALLLRKTFLEPTEDRGMWLANHPPSRLIGQPRHPFRGDSADSVSCDWYIWRKFSGTPWTPIVIDHLAKRRIRDEVTRG